MLFLLISPKRRFRNNVNDAWQSAPLDSRTVGRSSEFHSFRLHMRLTAGATQKHAAILVSRVAPHQQRASVSGSVPCPVIGASREREESNTGWHSYWVSAENERSEWTTRVPVPIISLCNLVMAWVFSLLFCSSLDMIQWHNFARYSPRRTGAQCEPMGRMIGHCVASLHKWTDRFRSWALPSASLVFSLPNIITTENHRGVARQKSQWH